MDAASRSKPASLPLGWADTLQQQVHVFTTCAPQTCYTASLAWTLRLDTAQCQLHPAITPTPAWAITWAFAMLSSISAGRVFSMKPIDGYRPPTLSGHRDSPIAVFFAGI